MVSGFKMPNQCLVCGQEGNIGFYSLPKNKDRRKLWIESAKIDEFFDENRKKYHCICFRHWKSEDIVFLGQTKKSSPKKGMFIIYIVLIIDKYYKTHGNIFLITY